MNQNFQHVFMVGAKNFGAYGGYETFVNKLTEYHQNNTKIKYHVVCKANGDGYMDERRLDHVQILSDKEFVYHNASCLKIRVPEIGSAQAIYYDVAALKACCRYIEERKISHPIIYIMACRIGPFMAYFRKEIHRLEGRIFLNPDGHEWMRKKWGVLTRKYWKLSERMMVRNCDFIVCDSVNIEKYIHETYDGKGIGGANPRTTYIAYGTETRKSVLKKDDIELAEWYRHKGLVEKGYYLVVGRFVPENNYEIIIREFMRSKTKKKLVIITNVNDRFLDKLENRLHFKSDKRIQFAGTVYEQELLMKIRENAYGYLHGHEVGGTNPSLLESLECTDLNLLLNVGFNREVAGDTALYWTKEEGSLSHLIDLADNMSMDQIKEYGARAHSKMAANYSWKYIADKYEDLFVISQEHCQSDDVR